MVSPVQQPACKYVYKCMLLSTFYIYVDFVLASATNDIGRLDTDGFINRIEQNRIEYYIPFYMTNVSDRL